MKLRNKKTGEIVELDYVGVSGKEITLYTVNPTTNEFCYGSLRAIVEDWEDYKPKEPLIKDEKIRNAVRAWADANNLAKVQSWYNDSNMIAEFSWYPIYLEIRTDNLGIANRRDYNDKEFYTIEELCGEEKE